MSKKTINRLASLLDPGKLATLKGERPVNTRVQKIVYWLEQARLSEGDELMHAQLDEAIKPYSNAVLAQLTKESALHNHRHAMRRGCLVSTEMEKMRHGRSPTIQKGKHQGEKLWVDHVIPYSLAPDLSACLPNLEYLPESLNRHKRDKLSQKHRWVADHLRDAGVISTNRHAELCSPAKFTTPPERSSGKLSVQQRKGVMATSGVSSSSFAGIGSSGSTDPRLILVKVQDFTDQLEDWEHRASHTMEKARFSTQHSAELVWRVAGVKVQASHRIQDDRVKLQRLDEDRRGWHDHVRNIQTHASEAAQRAQSALSAAQNGITFWNQKLSAAQSWLERAFRNERAAEEQYHRCERQLQNARSDLDRAYRELSEARQRRVVVGHDKENKPIYGSIDTSPYEQAVHEAESHVGWCRDQLNEARGILDDAIADRRAAEHKVGCCERAIRLANDSEASAERAIEICRDAQAAAARASEELNRLDFIAKTATTALTQANEAGERMETAAGLADSEIQGARSSLDNAEKLHSDSRNSSSKGRHEIAWRMSKLRAFDAPLNF